MARAIDDPFTTDDDNISDPFADSLTKAAAQAGKAGSILIGLNGLRAVWSGTQSQYDAISTKDPHTAYIVTS